MSSARVLIVCTANVCRSPMAAAFLRRRLGELGVPAQVTSAGTRVTDLPVDPVAVEVMAGFGLDVSGHVPRALTRELVAEEGRDLVVTMTREHLREVAVRERSAWPHAFTIKELVRRVEVAGGARGASLTFGPDLQWVGELAAGRRPADMMGDDPADDLADPYGRGIVEVRRTAGELQGLTGVVATLLAAPGPAADAANR